MDRLLGYVDFRTSILMVQEAYDTHPRDAAGCDIIYKARTPEVSASATARAECR